VAASPDAAIKVVVHTSGSVQSLLCAQRLNGAPGAGMVGTIAPASAGSTAPSFGIIGSPVLGSGSLAGGAASTGSLALAPASAPTDGSPMTAGGNAASLRAGGVTSGALAPPELPAIGAALAA
jgi:hypothetical protein